MEKWIISPFVTDGRRVLDKVETEWQWGASSLAFLAALLVTVWLLV